MDSKGVIMEDNRLFRWLGTALLIIMALTALYVLVGCRTKYVTVPEYHKEYINRTDTFLRSDTLYKLDSVVVRMQGDTTVIERIRWQNRFVNVYKVKTDTIIKTDSVRVPYPVEKKLSKWQQFKMDYGNVSMGGTVVAIVFIIIWLVKRFRIR
jgi:hypothetical protein